MTYKFAQCPICGEFGRTDKHRCPPVWCVRIVEGCNYYAGETAPTRVYARDAEQAAEEFAEDWDSQDSEYVLASGNEITVLVYRDDRPDDRHAFVVTGETVPTYHAYILEEAMEEKNG